MAASARRFVISSLAAAGLAAMIGAAQASSVLVINGNGFNSVTAPLTAAGFNVINDSFGPGAIAAHLSVPNDITEIWIWNDGTFGNTGSPVVPALAFSAADMAALHTFNAAHSHWIMDGLSWRSNGNLDEQNFTKNEAINLNAAGGGIVLGADDDSGAAIVQHVNQVAADFGFNLFAGVYITPPGTQQTGGVFLSSPNAVNPTNVVGTTTYSEVPNGMQGNGIFLTTAIFGQGTPYPGFGSPVLPSATFNGITYEHVNHVVTSDIPGGGIDPTPVPEPSTYALLALGLGVVGMVAQRRKSQA